MHVKSSSLTIAYSRPTTIGSVVAKSKLFEVEGQEVSKYITPPPFYLS
jgi:hypothetical protein